MKTLNKIKMNREYKNENYFKTIVVIWHQMLIEYNLI